jgi:hypothetical protein
MATQHLKVKSKATLEEVINQLEHLVVSLKKGKLCIRKSDEAITLGKESLREKLVIELKWKKGGQEPEKGDRVTITHLAPKFKL